MVWWLQIEFQVTDISLITMEILKSLMLMLMLKSIPKQLGEELKVK